MIREGQNSLPSSTDRRGLAGEVQVEEVVFRVVEAEMDWVKFMTLRLRSPSVQEMLSKKIVFEVWQG